jgi:hypothetical protein
MHTEKPCRSSFKAVVHIFQWKLKLKVLEKFQWYYRITRKSFQPFFHRVIACVHIYTRTVGQRIHTDAQRGY